MKEHVFTDEEMKAARRAYQRVWRTRNKEKVKDYNRRFWKKCAEKARLEQKGKEDEADNS